MTFEDYILHLEYQASPRLGRASREFKGTWNGKEIKVKCKLLVGRRNSLAENQDGQIKTLFYVNGALVARAELAEAAA